MTNPADETGIRRTPLEFRMNEIGLPVGIELTGWLARPEPDDSTMIGAHCSVERLSSARHSAQLHEAFSADKEGRVWTYLFTGPYDSIDDFRFWCETQSRLSDPKFFAIVSHATQTAVGFASYMRCKPEIGSIEVGNINYSPQLQRTAAATEAMFLMMSRAFDGLGYRRYEWKCDALNARSRSAALRLGFKFEGIFRNATVYKNRNRDTAWYSITDNEWPALKRGFQRWLAADNFDRNGRHRKSLAEIRSNPDND